MSSKTWVIPKHRLCITPSVSVPGRSAIDRKDKCVLHSEGAVWVLQMITVDKIYKNRKRSTGNSTDTMGNVMALNLKEILKFTKVNPLIIFCSINIVYILSMY